MSPPMLAGRKVPTNVLTKNTRSSGPIGGRRSDSIVQSSATHRYAISARSTRTSRTATPIHRQSTPAAAAATADGSLRQRM